MWNAALSSEKTFLWGVWNDNDALEKIACWFIFLCIYAFMQLALINKPLCQIIATLLYLSGTSKVIQ